MMRLPGIVLPATPVSLLSRKSILALRAKRSLSGAVMLVVCCSVFLAAGPSVASTSAQATGEDPASAPFDPTPVSSRTAAPFATDDQNVFDCADDAVSASGLLLAQTAAQCGDGQLQEGEVCEIGSTGPSCAALGISPCTAPLPCNSTCTGWDTSHC